MKASVENETNSANRISNSTTMSFRMIRKDIPKSSRVLRLVTISCLVLSCLAALVVGFQRQDLHLRTEAFARPRNGQTTADSWSLSRERIPNSDISCQHKRALYELPDGAEQIVGPNMRTSFSCDGLGYGYYADTDNGCKIFHICQSFRMSDGSIFNNHWSFLCGNQTIFNQVTLSCAHPEEAVPCESARDFYYVNDYFGDVRAPSVRDSDLETAHELVSRAYGSRLSRDSS